MPLTKVATLSELKSGQGKQVTVNGRLIALFRDGDRLFAIDDVCPHRGAPLHQGPCMGGQVMCPWHSARFDLTTGAALCPPAKSPVATYPVTLSGDDVHIEA